MGTLNLLEASKNLSNLCSIVIVTTDKVYENKEWKYGYRETDRLGGYDPYSASKAGAELVVESWRNVGNVEFYMRLSHMFLYSLMFSSAFSRRPAPS